MSRNIFGWDLPPGCTTGDIERAFADPPTSPEADEVGALLDEANVDEKTVDKVLEIVDRLAFRECPECARRQSEAEAKMDAEAAKEWEQTPDPKGNVMLMCCKQFAPVDAQKFLDIEEDMQGKDVMTFVCSNCGNQHKSHIYG